MIKTKTKWNENKGAEQTPTNIIRNIHFNLMFSDNDRDKC